MAKFIEQSLEKEKFSGELQQLRAKASFMDQLYNKLPSGLIVIDGNGIIEQVNSVAISLLGEPLEGQLWSNIIDRSFAPQNDDGHEVSLKNGSRIKLSISSLDGKPGQLIVLTDLTDTRRLQEHVSKLKRLSSLGKMVASLAHQIRTPLSAAMLYGANLSNKTLNESSRTRFQGKLMNRLNDLETQVNDMLLFAKSGDRKIIDEVSIGSLLAEVKNASDAIIENVEGNLQCALPDPDLLIMANKNSLVSALTNLVSNAVEATGKNAQLYITSKLRFDNTVEISVMDNGPGIDKAHLAKVTEAFYTTKSQGTGLGLAVVQAVAQAHKGSLEVRSEVGRGSCFTIILPLHRVAPYKDSDQLFIRAVGV